MAAAAVTVPASPVSANSAARRIWRAVRKNRKATAGAILLLFFIFLGLFPGLIAHDSPTAEIYGRSMGVSSAHLLGTSAYGQDLFAQVVWGTRQVLIIAFGAGLASTAIAAIIGVTAAYLGGAWDGVLNLITDVLLVIPLFPLLIVIAAYVQNSGTLC
jgi:peptide/nickel transport system permease protein